MRISGRSSSDPKAVIALVFEQTELETTATQVEQQIAKTFNKTKIQTLRKKLIRGLWSQCMVRRITIDWSDVKLIRPVMAG
jgi:hypothetical protein